MDRHSPVRRPETLLQHAEQRDLGRQPVGQGCTVVWLALNLRIWHCLWLVKLCIWRPCDLGKVTYTP